MSADTLPGIIRAAGDSVGMGYPVFPFTEAEFDCWARPAIGVASAAGEAAGLIRSHRPDPDEKLSVRLLRRDFCQIWPGHVAELIARCNKIPDGCWELCERRGDRVIEVIGWFIAADEK